MKNINMYYHKKVLVLGLARSGVSAASMLHKLGAFVTVNDKLPFSENPEAQGLLEQGIKVICGSHPTELLDEGFELVVKNPGIPYNKSNDSESRTFKTTYHYR
ncbi:UDP-N-acetylmuramoyl-L-alanyl-D-glutamate synthetase, partial [Listeria fleischmannii FSL S10-1203]